MKQKIFFGAIFIVIGILYGIQEIGLMNLGLSASIIFPVIMIIIGLILLIKSHNIIFGGILTLLGATSILDDWFPQVSKIVFPGILVIVGIEIIFGSLFRMNKVRIGMKVDSDDAINAMAFLGGVEKKVVSKDFKGGTATAMLGGVALDLTEVKLTSDAILDITAFMGGVEIRLPSDLQIKSDINGFLGGVEIKHRPVEPVGEYVLKLRGSAFMGAVEVK